MLKMIYFILILTLVVLSPSTLVAGESTGLGSWGKQVINAGESTGLGSWGKQIAPTFNDNLGLHGVNRLQEMIIGGGESTGIDRMAQELSRFKPASRPMARKLINLDAHTKPIIIRHNGKMIELDGIERIKLLSGEELRLDQAAKRPVQLTPEMLEKIDFIEQNSGQMLFPSELRQAVK